MQNERKFGSGDFILDAAIIISALLTFVKTADVFGYFAPESINLIFGNDVSYLYGMLSATIIEGVMLALHFNNRAHGYGPAEWTKWILLGISYLCQLYDGFLTTGTLAQQSAELKFVFQYLVPGLPILVLILIFAIRRLPEGQSGKSEWRGLKGYLPSMNYILHGRNVHKTNKEEGQDAVDQDDVVKDTLRASNLPAPIVVPTINNSRKFAKTKNWKKARKSLDVQDLRFIANGKEEDVAQAFKISTRTARRWREYARQELARL